MRRAVKAHPWSTYLVFQALTAVLSLAYAGVGSVDSTRADWLAIWAMLAVVGLVWTQVVWGPCWEAGGDYELPTTVRVAVMTLGGGALLVPCWFLDLVHDGGWLFIGMLLVPYGGFCGAVGGAALALRDRSCLSTQGSRTWRPEERKRSTG